MDDKMEKKRIKEALIKAFKNAVGDDGQLCRDKNGFDVITKYSINELKGVLPLMPPRYRQELKDDVEVLEELEEVTK